MNNYKQLQAITQARILLRHYIFKNDVILQFKDTFMQITSANLHHFILDTNFSMYRIQFNISKDENFLSLTEKYVADLCLTLKTTLENGVGADRFKSFVETFKPTNDVDKAALDILYAARDSGAHLQYLFSVLFIPFDSNYDTIIFQL